MGVHAANATQQQEHMTAKATQVGQHSKTQQIQLNKCNAVSAIIRASAAQQRNIAKVTGKANTVDASQSFQHSERNTANTTDARQQMRSPPRGQKMQHGKRNTTRTTDMPQRSLTRE